MKELRAERKDNNEQNPQRFESDTRKIIHRHLNNRDDIITEEDIRNIRVGLTPANGDNEKQREIPKDTSSSLDEEAQDADKEAIRRENPVIPWNAIEQ